MLSSSQPVPASLEDALGPRRRLRTAIGPQRFALFVRQDSERIDWLARLLMEEWMRPCPTPQAPAEHLGDDAEQEIQTNAGRSRRRRPDRVFAENGADRCAEYALGALCTGIECLRNDPDERKRGAERVADRGMATGRVPPEQPLGRQAQSRNAVLPPGEGERGRRNLDDIGAALCIEQIGAPELVQKGLAVVAVADHAVDVLRRRIRHHALDLAAATAQLRLCCHMPPQVGNTPQMFARTEGVSK